MNPPSTQELLDPVLKFQSVQDSMDTLKRDHQKAIQDFKLRVQTLLEEIRPHDHLDLAKMAIASLEGDIIPNLSWVNSFLLDWVMPRLQEAIDNARIAMLEDHTNVEIFHILGAALGTLRMDKDEYYFMFDCPYHSFFDKFDLSEVTEEVDKDLDENEAKEYEIQQKLKKLAESMWEIFVDGFEESSLNDLCYDIDDLQDLFVF